MTRPRICVYAIAKNEEQFVDRWMDSMSEADHIVVLDTGSTDGTAERLRRRGAEVTVEKIVPWRFDAARNRSLALVPENVDLCVCTDLDEVFRPGWRAALEKVWASDVAQISYRYTWSFTADGREGVVFWPEKIHSRRGWRWVHPVHEVLQWTGPGPAGGRVDPSGVHQDHKPDPKKKPAHNLPGVSVPGPLGRLHPYPAATPGPAHRPLGRRAGGLHALHRRGPDGKGTG